MSSEQYALFVFLIIVIVLIAGGLSFPYLDSQNKINEKEACPPKVIYPNGTKICK